MRSLYQDVIGHFIGWHYLSPRRILFHNFSLNGNVGRPIQIGSVNHPPMPLPILIFSFYHDGITFESFMPAFSDWYSNHQPCAMMIGIRTDESYTRFGPLRLSVNTALPMTSHGRQEQFQAIPTISTLSMIGNGRYLDLLLLH